MSITVYCPGGGLPENRPQSAGTTGTAVTAVAVAREAATATAPTPRTAATRVAGLDHLHLSLTLALDLGVDAHLRSSRPSASQALTGIRNNKRTACPRQPDGHAPVEMDRHDNLPQQRRPETMDANNGVRIRDDSRPDHDSRASLRSPGPAHTVDRVGSRTHHSFKSSSSTVCCTRSGRVESRVERWRGGSWSAGWFPPRPSWWRSRPPAREPQCPAGLLRFQRPPVEPCVRFSRTRLTDVVHRRHSVFPASPGWVWGRQRFHQG